MVNEFPAIHDRPFIKAHLASGNRRRNKFTVDKIVADLEFGVLLGQQILDLVDENGLSTTTLPFHNNVDSKLSIFINSVYCVPHFKSHFKLIKQAKITRMPKSWERTK